MSEKKLLSQFIESERIYLREVRQSDANETYYRWMNDPEVVRYLESRFRPNSMESIRSYVERFDNDPDNIFLAIILKEGDIHIGNIKLGPINWHHRLADIGIIVGEKDQWGKGYASEAISLIAEYAFNVLNLHKLTAGCYAENHGSLKSFQKSNFTIEGVRKSHCFYDGKYTDMIMLGLINPMENSNAD